MKFSKLNQMYITRNLDEFLNAHGCEFLKQVISCMQESIEISAEEFQVWRLKRKHKSKFILVLDDGNFKKIITIAIELPNCTINKLKIYFENYVLCFPDER